MKCQYTTLLAYFLHTELCYVFTVCRVRVMRICISFIFTVQRQWRSSVTSTWVTDHSRCRSGKGKTLAAGYGRGS